MNDQTAIRIALWLGVLNLMITVSHMIHDVVEFADIRYHIDQAHPGFEK